MTTDQRGLPNTNTSYRGFSAGAACVDAGAVQTNYALSFTQQPSNTVFGVSMLPAPAVTLTESGNAFTAAGVTIPLTLTGSGTLGGGSATTSAGVATYSSLNVSASGSNDTLTAALSLNPVPTPALSLTAVSSEFNIVAGTPTAANSSFALPATAVAGTTITGTLTLKDQDGNLVLPTSVTFTTPSTTTAFSTPTTVMTANGVATIGLSDTKAETVTIGVSMGGTPFLSGTVQITPAAPASVSVVSGTPQSATVNTQFAAPLVVVIADKFGNPTPNAAVPSFGVPATGASAILTTAAETNSKGERDGYSKQHVGTVQRNGDRAEYDGDVRSDQQRSHANDHLHAAGIACNLRCGSDHADGKCEFAATCDLRGDGASDGEWIGPYDHGRWNCGDYREPGGKSYLRRSDAGSAEPDGEPAADGHHGRRKPRGGDADADDHADSDGGGDDRRNSNDAERNGDVLR